MHPHPVHNYRRLDVWVRSYELTLSIYTATSGWPSGERFGLVSQLRRAAVSIPSNIAEGSSQASRRGFGRYLRTALGSAAEVDTQLRLARDLGYLSHRLGASLLGEVDGVSRMLVSLLHNQSDREASS